jgi:hypothetical protein
MAVNFARLPALLGKADHGRDPRRSADRSRYRVLVAGGRGGGNGGCER